MTATAILENIYLGNSHDARVGEHGCDAVLNCAHDLENANQWSRVHLAQCGLVDGPGNPLAAYYSAVFQLHTLLKLGKRVLVHCHAGESRSVAVIIMYLHAIYPGVGWDLHRDTIKALVAPRVIPVNAPHSAHREAFDKMDFDFVRAVIA